MKNGLIVAATVLSTLLAVAIDARAQAAADKRVYTVCTLLVGRRNAKPAVGPGANIAKGDGSTMTMFGGESNPLTPSASLQMEKDLVSLQDKLKSAFQLEQIEAVASLGDWMPVGRELVLQPPGRGLRLLVTAAGLVAGADPPFVATVPRGGGKPSDYEQGYATAVNGVNHSAQYTINLTAGTSSVFDRPMTVTLGERNVFARQPQPDGPVYFVVIAAPVMETTHGLAIGGIVSEPRQIRGPQLVSGPDPLLPPEVRALIKGTLILRATIAPDGTVGDVKVTEPAEGVTERAVAALRQRRYTPALDENGRPMAVQIVVAIKPGAEPESEP